MSLRQLYNYFDKVYKKRNPALMEGYDISPEQNEKR